MSIRDLELKHDELISNYQKDLKNNLIREGYTTYNDLITLIDNLIDYGELSISGLISVATIEE
jgi:hypothetical protein